MIDPGHGGLDGGAVSTDGALESAVNLEIALKLRDLCRLYSVRNALTRSGEVLPYPPELSTIREKKVWDQRQRVAMANAAEGTVLLSIHQNYYPDPRPCGSQVLFAKAPGSEGFATVVHENLARCLCPDNRRVAAPAPKSVYLMEAAQCPAILVECGFLSNPAEAAKLGEEGYQREIAAVLLASYLCFVQTRES